MKKLVKILENGFTKQFCPCHLYDLACETVNKPNCIILKIIRAIQYLRVVFGPHPGQEIFEIGSTRARRDLIWAKIGLFLLARKLPKKEGHPLIQ